MTGRGVVMGQRVGPIAAQLDAGLLERFAAATNDASPAVRGGAAVPPAILATLLWEAQDASRADLVPPELRTAATGGVHGEHDIVVHRPIEPDEALHTWVEGWGARPAGRNSLVTLRYLTFDAGDALVAEQWWTTVWLGVSCDADGEPAPEHAFPDDARKRGVGSRSVAVDSGIAERYASVSGDWSGHHFDLDAARASGFDRVFLHGLCTFAMCAHVVADVAAGGDPRRLRRLAVRFARPTFLGEQLDVRVYDAGALGLAFEADCAGMPVITNGRAELHP